MRTTHDGHEDDRIRTPLAARTQPVKPVEKKKPIENELEFALPDDVDEEAVQNRRDDPAGPGDCPVSLD